jgi:hypothetical protein
MMIAVLQRRGRPLFGYVPTANKFDVGQRLLRLGFQYLGRAGAPLHEDAYRWIPG